MIHMDETELSERVRSDLERQSWRALRIWRRTKRRFTDSDPAGFEGVTGKSQIRGVTLILLQATDPIPIETS